MNTNRKLVKSDRNGHRSETTEYNERLRLRLNFFGWVISIALLSQVAPEQLERWRPALDHLFRTMTDTP